jgi:hypothetical protein
MSRIYRHRHGVRALAVFVCTLLGLAASAPAAFALRVPATFGSSGDAPTDLHSVPPTVVTGGTPGWQIAVLVVLAALVAGTLAVLVDRMWRQRRHRIMPAAS